MGYVCGIHDASPSVVVTSEHVLYHLYLCRFCHDRVVKSRKAFYYVEIILANFCAYNIQKIA